MQRPPYHIVMYLMTDIKLPKWGSLGRGMTQVVQYLYSKLKLKALSSNPCTTRKKENKK
jgi:hypothetical protein